MNQNSGRRAEQIAADWLNANGYRIIDSNWRTRWCEIDIIAIKQRATYFIEVKYRRSSANGDGLDYITDRKLRQMQFAAEIWQARHYPEGEVLLAALTVFGPDFRVEQFQIII